MDGWMDGLNGWTGNRSGWTDGCMDENVVEGQVQEWQLPHEFPPQGLALGVLSACIILQDIPLA